MSDPVGNLRYCFMPLIAYIVDTPEQSLLACTGPKASPVSTATHKQFGDPFPHPPRTPTKTLGDIQLILKNFSKSSSACFLMAYSCRFGGIGCSPIPLFFSSQKFSIISIVFFWDHDLWWCIAVLTLDEIDYRFSLIQTAIRYCSFEEGVLS